MAMTMHVDVVTAEQEIYSGPAEEVFAPAELGEVGILPRHSPLITRLAPGEVRIRRGGSQPDEHIFVAGGILEVQPHVVTILADTGMRAADLDEARALEARQRAEEAMQQRDSEIDYAKAKAELAEAIAQLRMLERMRKLKR